MSKTTLEHLAEGAVRVSYTDTYLVNRTGWLGVWDGVVSVFRRHSRRTVNQPIEFTMYVKTDDPVILLGSQTLEVQDVL